MMWEAGAERFEHAELAGVQHREAEETEAEEGRRERREEEREEEMRGGYVVSETEGPLALFAEARAARWRAQQSGEEERGENGRDEWELREESRVKIGETETKREEEADGKRKAVADAVVILDDADEGDAPVLCQKSSKAFSSSSSFPSSSVPSSSSQKRVPDVSKDEQIAKLLSKGKEVPPELLSSSPAACGCSTR